LSCTARSAVRPPIAGESVNQGLAAAVEIASSKPPPPAGGVKGDKSMFVLGNLIAAAAHILDIALTAYMWIIVIRAVLSWVNPDPYNPIVRFIHQVTEPVMAPIRRRLPIRGLGIDFSPIIILLAIVFLQGFLVKSLLELSYHFR
jgi:YggT family protein